jgi:hypothetical protein
MNVVQVGIDYWGSFGIVTRAGRVGAVMEADASFPSCSRDYFLAMRRLPHPQKHFRRWNSEKTTMCTEKGGLGRRRRPKREPYEHLHPSEWTPTQWQSKRYRRANTTSARVDQALAMRLLKAEKYWNHNAFFGLRGSLDD